MVKDTRFSEVYQVADRFIEAALRKSDSVFTPGTAIWTQEVLDDFYERFIGQPDTSSDSFETKLQRQLEGAPPETIQLAGEVICLHFLIASSINGDTKRRIINHVLSWSEAPVSIPSDLDAALDTGIVGVGVSFHTHRPFQLQFLLDFAREWKKLSPEDVDKLLADPWAFKNFVGGVPLKAAYAQRDALLHLVHPGTFDHIVSRDAKQRIAQHFAELVSEPTQDVDKQLFQIRKALSESYGSDFDFYHPELRSQWQSDPSKWGRFVEWARRFFERPEFDEEERDYKLEVAERLAEARQAVVDEADDWQEKLRKAFTKPNNLTSWQSHDKFLSWCKREPEAALEALQTIWAAAEDATERIRTFLAAVPADAASGPGTRTSLASFLHMASDPTVYPFFKTRLFQQAFELTGHPSPPKADEADTYKYALDFLDKLSEESSKRGLELRDRLDAQGVLWSVVSRRDAPKWMSKEDRVAFCEYLGIECEPKGGNGTDPPDSLKELEDSLLLVPGYLAQVDRLLRSKKQLIFHGPPGTGKTYVARELARFYAQDKGQAEIVQFHPSYAYEDFIDGYRPKLLEGRPGFALKEGPLKRIARQAAANPGAKFVLVIDEINRGNLAKVFGELYFLLEYRMEEITLQYSDERFSLPDNLWFIGTMNTADRSIALVDSALRRRFHFIPFFPDEQPIQGLLGRWLAKHKPELGWLAAVVDEANAKLGDRHTAIGPSYFLRVDLDEGWIELIWKHSILPYLQEQFFGDEDRLEEFQLARLRRQDSKTESEPTEPS